MNTEAIRNWMTEKVITIAPDITIAEAARLMVEHKIGGLPVIKQGALVGVITVTDLCRVLMSQPEII